MNKKLSGKPARDGQIVLYEISGYHPFVTWVEADNGDRYWGHYWLTLTEAKIDFNARNF